MVIGTQPRSLCQVIEKKKQSKTKLRKNHKNEGKVELQLPPLFCFCTLSPDPHPLTPHTICAQKQLAVVLFSSSNTFKEVKLIEDGMEPQKQRREITKRRRPKKSPPYEKIWRFPPGRALPRSQSNLPTILCSIH